MHGFVLRQFVGALRTLLPRVFQLLLPGLCRQDSILFLLLRVFHDFLVG